MIPVPVRFRFGRFGLGARLVLFVVLALLGAALQIAVSGAFVPGLLIMAAGLPLLAAVPWTNKPADLGEEAWTAVGEAEFDRLADSFRSARKLKVPFLYRPLAGLPITVVLVFLAFSTGAADPRIGAVFADAAVLFWPALHFLKVRVWVPRNLSLAMEALQAALSADLPAGVSAVPYLRLDRDAQGLRIPEDARIMLEPRRAVGDLVGVQLQVAINNGPNGAVPYLYAVVITRGKAESWRRAAELRRSLRNFEVEAGGDDEWGSVVIRQKTGGGGYRTDPSECRRIAGVACEFLTRIAPSGRAGS